MLYAMLSASWNLINGYTGIFTFGHQAFFGLGAYGSALLAMHARLDSLDHAVVWRRGGCAGRSAHWIAGAAYSLDRSRGDCDFGLCRHRADRGL